MLIDGKAIAQTIYTDIAARVSTLPFTPVFCDVLIGDDPASIQYVHMKAKRAEQLGFKFLRSDFTNSVSEADVLTRISEIGHMPEVAGLIVQLPTPAGFNQSALVNAISPDIDVDCLTAINSSLFYAGHLSFVPPTPAAVLAVLDSLALPPERLARCVVVGQGDLVGRPVSFLLRARGMRVDTVTRETEYPERIARQADVLITAAGQPGLVTAEWVKPGAVVIDAGTAESGGSVVGDVDRASVNDIPAYFSPTPGGVGPVTIAKLFWNVLRVAERKAGISKK